MAAKHCVVFYDCKTCKVKAIIESYIFTHGRDNMTNYCAEEDDRLILGVILSDEHILKMREMEVVRDLNNFYIKIGDEKVYIYKKEEIKGLPLIIDCDVFSGTGYGMLSREFMKRIVSRDLGIKINPINSSGLFQTCLTEQEGREFQKHFISQVDLEKLENYIHLRMYPPRINFPRKRYNVTYTMLESYTLNHFYVKMMESSYDDFIVPTNFIKDVFSQNINKDRVSVVPLGIDPEVFHPNVVVEDVQFKEVDLKNKVIQPTDKKPSGFRFLSAARFSHRKGCDLVLRAFANEFEKKKDDVSLVLFYLPENENNKQHLINRILGILSKFDMKKIPPIFLQNEPWPTDQQYLPYGWGDCFVFPSRGEGFGLTPMESGACKIPVISSDNSGLSDFITDETAFVVPMDFTDDIGTMGQNGYVGKHPEWAEDILHPHTWGCEFPIMNGQDTVDLIGSHMRYVYENPYSEKVNKKVENFYNLIQEKYTWDVVSEQLYQELRKYS